MRPSFVATMLICGTIMVLFPFIYHLHIHANTSLVLAHRADTTPNADWGSHGPVIPPLQAAIGMIGFVFLVVGFLGGLIDAINTKRGKKEKDVRVPLDIILKAHAPEAVQQSPQNALPPKNVNSAAAGRPQETKRIGVQRTA